MQRDDDRIPQSLIYAPLALTATVTTLTEIDMNVDGGASPKTFFYQCDNTLGCHLTKMTAHIVDGSINPGDMGGIGNGVTNGIEITFNDTNGSVLLNVTNIHKIKKNSDFIALAGEKAVIVTSAGNDLLSLTWDLYQDHKSVLLKFGQQIRVTINDTMTAIPEFHTFVHGYKI